MSSTGTSGNDLTPDTCDVAQDWSPHAELPLGKIIGRRTQELVPMSKHPATERDRTVVAVSLPEARPMFYRTGQPAVVGSTIPVTRVPAAPEERLAGHCRWRMPRTVW